MALALREPTWLVRSLDDYVDLVRRYVSAFEGSCKGRVRQEMEAARRRLNEKLLTTPLFDTALWAHDWQRALRLVWEAFRGSSLGGQRHVVVAASS